MHTDRRKFIDILFNTGILGTLAAIIYPVTQFLMPPEKREPRSPNLN